MRTCQQSSVVFLMPTLLSTILLLSPQPFVWLQHGCLGCSPTPARAGISLVSSWTLSILENSAC